jgi:hypothetical protein
MTAHAPIPSAAIRWPATPRAPGAWWTGRRFLAFAAVCALVPLLWPALPPLVDLPGHVGRYRILADAGHGPLARHWAIHWGLIGNLGVDLLVVALHPLLDVEPAARLVVTLIPLATVLALLWLAREVHGRLPASAAFALPLAYAFPFQLGFVNFCLAQAMALAGLALWLRLARTRPAWWRIAIFAPLACLVWLAHSFGWAMLGLFAFGAQWQLERGGGRAPVAAAVRAGLLCLPMALPVAAMLGWGTTATDRLAGSTCDWFNWLAKAQWLASLLGERWMWWDLDAVLLLAGVIWWAVRSPAVRFAPVLGIPALLGFAAFVALPRVLQGGAYVDTRMLPATVMLALLSIRIVPGAPQVERRVAMVGAAFLLARTIGTTVAFALYAAGQSAALAAVPALPAGDAVLVLVDEPASTIWGQPRLTHVAGLAVARARVFVNEQWALPGQQPIRPLHPRAAPLDRDPSQLVYPRYKADRTTDLDDAVARFDRCTYRAVWTIGFPPGRVRARDLTPVWGDGRSAVYRVIPPVAGACP